MALHDTVNAVRRWRSWLPARRRAGAVGNTEVANARRLADAERIGGGCPDGCAWLDDRTVDDLDLPLVFRAIDRTATPTGAQALWRWLVAPAVRLDVLAARERGLARLTAHPALCGQLRDALAGHAESDAPHLPRLLWEPPHGPLRIGMFAALSGLVIALGVLSVWWPPLVLACAALFIANVLIDDWASIRLAPQAHALSVLARVLGSTQRVVADRLWEDAEIAADLVVLLPLRKRIAWLTVKDPFGLADLVRGGLLARLLLLGGAMRVIERERARFRRVVLWLGEIDALVSIASLRTERADARLPELAAGPARISAHGLVHPAITEAVGNDIVLDTGLIVTGSNMSGKSTFLRTLAINAICAQSIHTTFGSWHASLFRVFAVMRSSDALADGMSKYAVEVAAIGKLVAAVSCEDRQLPALLVVDEPFSGTNPALRVPIVVEVLDHLARRDLAIAATHDLDVAAQVGPRFVRAYFREPDDRTGQFDRKLRPGVSPGSNALALLIRAGYPQEIIAAVERRVTETSGELETRIPVP
ncbi:MAG TPA: hypothetical protein VHT91_11875 [Kofleriaceae bacterium]|jgi:hypothetical protein|nr:hypothetical protein [Kofleriaceae bacterium]